MIVSYRIDWAITSGNFGGSAVQINVVIVIELLIPIVLPKVDKGCQYIVQE